MEHDMNIGFLISFFTGAASVISPCVLPLIPIIVGHSILKKKFSQTTAFILGFFLVFTIITVLTVLFTAAINYYLLYFRITAALLLIGVGIFFIIDKNIFKHSYTPKSNSKNTGSFMLGFLTCLAWSPCYGPYIVAIATYSASTGNLVYTTVNMALFAAGYSLTLLLIGIFASKLNFERLITYSKWIRIGSGAIIFIAGLYLLLNLL
ncbi:cytochrome c biogenesis CcdA family protein [Methanobacterium arcticum]|nr:cytochrome c biogenesis CcdA family protein [Methanobacterium arcticum]